MARPCGHLCSSTKPLGVYAVGVVERALTSLDDVAGRAAVDAGRRRQADAGVESADGCEDQKGELNQLRAASIVSNDPGHRETYLAVPS